MAFPSTGRARRSLTSNRRPIREAPTDAPLWLKTFVAAIACTIMQQSGGGAAL